MYSVILVDDDELVRVGLESLDCFSAKGFQIIDALSSGRQALASIEKNQPDVVITDMYMPEIDGLQIIRDGKKLCPDTIFVVLSCHNDIDSIKEALHLGAFDYLLKSSIVDPKNAEKLMDRILAACNMRKVSRGSALSGHAPNDKQLILSYLRGESGCTAAAKQALLRRGFDLTSSNIFLAGLQLDNYSTIQQMVSDERALLQKIEQHIDRLLEAYGSGFAMYYKDGLFFLLQQVNSVTAAISPYSRMLSICERMRISMKNQFLHTCSIYINHSQRSDQLPQACRTILSEINSTRSINFDSVIDLVAGSASIYDTQEDPDVEVPSGAIDNVIHYIEAHYASPITLDELAGIANFSKYHLCRKFKEVTHTGIVNYILSYRIEKAKELLKQADSRFVFEIAQAVGFNDASYFNRTFKKFTGYTPNEYQKLDQPETH